VRDRASIDGGVNPAKLYCTDLNKVSLNFFLLSSLIYRYLLYVALFALTYISISSTRPTPSENQPLELPRRGENIDDLLLDIAIFGHGRLLISIFSGDFNSCLACRFKFERPSAST
jgi:hypothetical protein